MLRAQERNDPFMIGQIVELMPNTERMRKDQRMTLAYRQHSPGLMRIRTPALHPRIAQLHELDERLLLLMRAARLSLRSAGLAAAASAVPWPSFEIRASRRQSEQVYNWNANGAFTFTFTLCQSEEVYSVTHPRSGWREQALACACEAEISLCLDCFFVSSRSELYGFLCCLLVSLVILTRSAQQQQAQQQKQLLERQPPSKKQEEAVQQVLPQQRQQQLYA